MALFVNQNSNRSKLQERLAAELQEKARSSAGKTETEAPDGVHDSAYLQGTKETTSLAWVWALIVIAAVGAAIWLVIVTLNR